MMSPKMVGVSCPEMAFRLALLVVLPLLVAADLLGVPKCQERHSWDNLDHFTEFGLVPNPIPCQPKHTATIFYNQDDYVLVGNRLTKEQAKNEPVINFPAFQRQTNYTAIMVDVDAPSRDNPNASPFLHFLAVNSYEVIIGASDKVASYIAPSPPPGSGYHRYIWLLYEQSRYIDPNNVGSYETNRENFPLKRFASDNGLSNPASGNMFQTQA